MYSRGSRARPRSVINAKCAKSGRAKDVEEYPLRVGRLVVRPSVAEQRRRHVHGLGEGSRCQSLLPARDAKQLASALKSRALSRTE